MKSATFRSTIVPSVALAALLAGWFWITSPSTVATVVEASVSSGVQVRYDESKVAHVFASTSRDAAFGMGYVHAKHRDLQLEVARRVPSGRLSELVGPGAVGNDTLMRRLQLSQEALRQFNLLPKRERELLEAYASGVNAGRREVPTTGIASLLMGGVERLEWRGEDCVAWSMFMALLLAGNWQSELDRLTLSRKLSSDDVALLIPSSFGPGSDESAAQSIATVDDPIASLSLSVNEAIGSNSWVVTGDRSKSGGSLLANDPHLPLTTPSPWFLARISVHSSDASEQVDVLGATTPGLPMVLLGRTRNVAWGMTRNGADTQDLFLEEVDPRDETRYRAGAKWASFSSRSEVLNVRGQPPRTILIESTSHGPIVGELPKSHAETGEETRYKVALQWDAFRHHAGSISAAFAANRATNCATLLDAFKTYAAPVQNVLAGDADGRACFRVAGWIPRPTATTGMLPKPGWQMSDSTPRQRLAEEEMPRIADAKAGGIALIANANQQLEGQLGENLPGEWDRPNRYRRIMTMLSAESRHDRQSFQRIQYDIRSEEALRLVPALLRAQPAGALARSAVKELAVFDGEMRPDRVAPLVYTVWIDEFTRLVLGRRVGSAQFGGLYGRRTFRSAVERILLDSSVGAQWCSTPECVSELNESLSRAVVKLSANRGSRIEDWQWGVAHAVDRLDPISILLGEHAKHNGFEVGGDSSTVNMTHYEIGSGTTKYPTRVGANARFIYDLGDANSSWFVQFGGPDELENASGRRFTRDWQYGHFSELRFEPRRWEETISLLPHR